MSHVHDICFGNVILMIHSLYLINYLNSLYNQKEKLFFFFKQKQNLKKNHMHAKYQIPWCQVFSATCRSLCVGGTPALSFFFLKLILK